MQAVKNMQGQGVGSTNSFPLKGSTTEFKNDLASIGFPVDIFMSDEGAEDDVAVSTFCGPAGNGDGDEGAVFISALLEYEEAGQSVDLEPRDLLDVIARHIRDGHVAVLNESTFKGHTARRWAVDSKGGRVSIDLVDLETQIVERLDCSAGIPDLD